MRKFWAKFFSFALIMIVMVSFTACSLFTENLDKKYSASVMVAWAGDKDSDISVSKKELYNAYLQWGYQYANQMATEDLLNALTESILNDKIMKKLSLEKFGDLYDGEKALALKNAYQAIDDTLRQYVYDALDLDDPEASTNSTTDDKVTYTPYTKSIFVEQCNDDENRADPYTAFTLNLESYADTAGNLRSADYQKYTPNVPGVATDKVAKQALSKIVRTLQNMENGFEKLANSDEYLNLDSKLLAGLSKTEQYVLNREIARLVDNNQTSILVSRMSVAYNLGLETAAEWQAYLNRGSSVETWEAWQKSINTDVVFDADGKTVVTPKGKGRSIAENRAKEVIKDYQDKVKNAILSYQLSASSDYESTVMGGSLDSIYYIPQAVANNLFTVSHILIGFTDEQKALYNTIMEEAKNDENYNPEEALNDLYAQTTSNGKNVYDIYNEVKSTLNGTNNLQEKYDLFRDFIYQYNTDPGMQNPTYEYLMSVNKDKNGMIESFTDASIALKEDGVKGAISGIVWGEYGAHIIMYTRDVAEFVWTGEATTLDRDYGKTLFASLTAYGNQTKFDVLAESHTRNYSNYEATLLREFKSANQITINKDYFKNFF